MQNMRSLLHWQKERILCHRLKKHQICKTSGCIQHVESHPAHQIEYQNVEILDSATSYNMLGIKGLLHILVAALDSTNSPVASPAMKLKLCLFKPSSTKSGKITGLQLTFLAHLYPLKIKT